MGFVFQAYHLLPDLDALENVMLPAQVMRLSRSIIDSRARDLLGKVGLGARMDHRPSELSGGEQQRVAIARALMNEPEVVLADEPTGNLDLGNANRLVDLFKKINTDFNQAFVITTHNPEVAAIGNKQFYLENGSLSFSDRV